MKQNNIVYNDNGKWWFWDELGLYRFGPYDNRDDAVKSWFLYCKYLDKQGWDNKQKNLQKQDIDWEFVILVMVLTIFLSVVVYLLT